MSEEASFRWLGAAGIELIAEGRCLLVDPYVTRIPFWQSLVGRVRPDPERIARAVSHCDYAGQPRPHRPHPRRA